MADDSLPPNIALGHVRLTVSNVERSLAYYQNALGFKIHRREGGAAYLGAGQADLLALTEHPGARRDPNRTGLYHFAILVPSRPELARSLQRIAETQAPVQGFADHLVSEAIYLSDPLLPNRPEVNRVLDRVRLANQSVEEHPLGWLVRDPSQNAIVFGLE